MAPGAGVSIVPNGWVALALSTLSVFAPSVVACPSASYATAYTWKVERHSAFARQVDMVLEDGTRHILGPNCNDLVRDLMDPLVCIWQPLPSHGMPRVSIT